MTLVSRASLFSSLSTLALLAAPAAAQNQDPPAEQAETTQADVASGDAIIVTGTRRTDRTLAESPVPIDVIGGEALTETGFTEVNRILNQVVPSFNFPQPSITDGTDVLRPATLRGLSPDQTLVLVNGKRRHPSALLNINGSVGRGSAAVDLNTIPPLAIDRIEVLRDGASSQYGSDAIAGVINVQLRRRPGGQFQATYGRYHTSLKDVPTVTGVQLGANGQPVIDADGNFVLIDNGEDRRARDGDTITSALHYGFAVGKTGYLNLTAEYRNREATNRSGYDPRRQFPTVGGLSDPREFTFDRLNHRYGDAETHDLNLFFNAGTELGAAIEFYTFGSYSTREGESAGFFRRANDARNRNFSASTTTFVPFYPTGFLPLITSDIEDYSLAAGVRGTVSGWNWDFSHVYGHNGFDFGVANSFNTSFGAASQTRFDAGGLRFGQHVTNLDVQREFDVGGLHEVSIALGAEHRHENFDIVAGDVQSYAGGPFAAAPFNAPAGAQVFPGFRPANEVDAKRHSWAGYAELDADITENLTVQVAGRYEDYSDFGSTLNGKIAARFAPVEWFALRGSASTGFRAPSLHQQFYSTTSTNNVNGVLLEIGTFPVSSPVAVALGSQPLQPEESKNYSVGLTLTPGEGLNITADWYQVSIDDRIVVTENLQGAAVVALLQGAGFNSITSARFFINGIDTRTRGLDIVGTYRIRDTGFGNFTLTAGYNRNKTRITDRAVLPTLPGLTLFGRVESLRIEQGQPRDKINLGLDWDSGIFGATVRTNRYGDVLVPAATAAGDETLEARWVTDAELRLEGGEGVQFAIGANNVFDVYPSRASVGGVFGTNPYFIPYSSFSPFGFNGRFVYGRMSVRF
ncbi:TonB-dependent receptor [Sphingomonas parva]|uniref:TonB-dependent receptor n=1 Tax=Sphingomonas parva TaxID=2555898 RepID=A0A4Y8ZSS8_9SPHN|nr:TonB-dependent receptor [Sphingomonas parva]TFI58342.1 TonB-dependent receptor [Sphingomonas parva]